MEQGRTPSRGVSAREFMISFENILPRALSERGVAYEEFFQNHARARQLTRVMPSTAVAVELTSAWHRNRDHKWTANDIFDIDALSGAVPYCDIVVMEKACHHVLVSAGFESLMHTALLRSILD